MFDLHHHDICDAVWDHLKPHLPRVKGSRFVRISNNRLFLNKILWKLCTGHLGF
jgi:transposase